MSSRLAKIRFVADSTNSTYWGSNTDEQKEIERIRRKFARYLYDESPPKKIVNKLGPIAERLIENTNISDALVSMYER